MNRCARGPNHNSDITHSNELPAKSTQGIVIFTKPSKQLLALAIGHSIGSVRESDSIDTHCVKAYACI